jgi:hypothetical protein
MQAVASKIGSSKIPIPFSGTQIHHLLIMLTIKTDQHKYKIAVEGVRNKGGKMQIQINNGSIPIY